ncbi:PD-(D/E)XK nuclease family protein [Flavobacterium sp.]|uniref:PD-(D/E)XK nuclease family protein n=1 Tax=Flavobacterium sp. TaxID=239 RepID=UPI0035274CF6
MKSTSFISLLAKHIVINYAATIEELVVVLPNKRAKVFLLEELKNEIQQNSFAPKIISIEDFIQDIAGIRSVDSIELLFEFYTIYSRLADNDKQPFEQFSKWGKTLLHDFNEIDRYLFEPNYVFSYLKDIEALKRWNLEPQDKTKLIDNYLLFWESIPLYYQEFYKHLLSKGIGYQGLIYREAVDNLNYFSENLKQQVIFAGFNALNQAEEKIIQHLLSIEKADVLWDVEETFLNDSYHDAGLFARKIKKSWPYYKSNSYQWIFNEFKKPKQIQIMGTPKTIGQAKLVGEIIESISLEHKLQNIAIILGEENMLIPLLHSLPESVSHLNITMGYSGKNNPAQLLVAKLFKMHQNAHKRSHTNSYVFYYKDVLDVLQNPLVDPIVQAESVVKKINNNNYSFITLTKLVEFYEVDNSFFSLLFQRWEANPLQILQRVSSILLQIRSFLQEKTPEDKLTSSFVFAVFKVINKLTTYCEQHNHITTIEGLFLLYKEIIDLAEVSFEGEPLQGLQIMGVLESRVLDFETVIITSMNEGIFPAGKNQNSFIPLDVKREIGLPTFKEKDAIYTYHFYHLLQRAKNIYLLYNTESEGIDAGEKSRFITQLEVEKQPNHVLTHQVYNAYLPENARKQIVVEKSDLIMNRLQEMAESGFSPSTITTYIRNPIQFYFQRILRISEIDEVEENIAVNTLGTIIHKALEELYKPYLNTFLTSSMLECMLQLVNEEVFKQFKEVYKEGEIAKGKNLLAFEVAKRNVFNFIQLEKQQLEFGDAVKVLFLEQNFEQILLDERLPFPIKIKGNVDRIELRNGMIRIIDYKTGKVEQKDLSIQHWEGLMEDIKHDKVIQLLCYALMVQSEFKGMEVEVGIISFKNLKAGFMPFQIKQGREVISNKVNASIVEDFKTELINLLNFILEKSISFEEKIN